jgi:hypothetical protein
MTQDIYDDIRRAVARCIPQNSMLRIGPLAASIAERHASVSARAVAEELLQAGVAAAVPIEIEMPSGQRVEPE